MAISEKYKKHRWKFLSVGVVSGLLMSLAANTTNTAQLIGDTFGGAILWLFIWWIWAWSKTRAETNAENKEQSTK